MPASSEAVGPCVARLDVRRVAATSPPGGGDRSAGFSSCAALGISELVPQYERACGQEFPRAWFGSMALRETRAPPRWRGVVHCLLGVVLVLGDGAVMGVEDPVGECEQGGPVGCHHDCAVLHEGSQG